MRRFYFKIILLFAVIFPLRLTQATSFQAFDSVWDVMHHEFKLNHQLHRPEVQREIRWLIAHPGYLQNLSQAKPYLYHIVTEIKKRNLPGELALIPMIESTYDPFVYSGKGAAGLWQIMPSTGKELGLTKDWWADSRRGITHSTHAALNYLDYLQHVFEGNWHLAIAAYDAGEGRITRALKSGHQSLNKADFWSLSIPQETKNYVPRLLALAEIISHAESYRVSLPFIPHTPYFEEVKIHQQMDLNHAAELAGMSYKEFTQLNPEFNHWARTPHQPFKLLIPKSRVHHFHENLAKQDKPKRLTHHTERLKRKSTIRLPKYLKTIHIVQRNESIQHIAQKYHTNPYTIYQWNHLKTSLKIHAGQQLVIWRPSKTLRSTERLPKIG